MSKKVTIIGGGIIGLCSAYYLHKEGHQVTVVDQSSMDYGASYVNAGYLSPSHIIPLAAPGVMKKGLKWMFNPSSPLFIRPSLRPEFLKWVWAFNKSCSAKNVTKGIPAIKDIAVLGRELYDDFKKEDGFAFHLDKKGLLMVCKTEKMLEEEIRVAEIAKQHGLDVNEISKEALKNIYPETTVDALGAVHYHSDWHTTPNTFMSAIKSYLEASGVVILKNKKITDINITNGKVNAISNAQESFTADEFVLAAGSWSKLLSKKIGVSLLLEPGKGYRINSTRDLGITIPAILSEAKVAITPMQGFTRFAGTMEIAGINHDINKIRVDAIANATKQYYPDIELTYDEKSKAACGLRPVSPDGLPYIGKPGKCKNLTIATGHAMMGWSMGTATGKLVSEIISGKKTSMDIDIYHPDRKF